MGIFTGGLIFPGGARAGLGSGLCLALLARVGVFFDYYPANRAANLDPIVRVRYE